MRKVLILSAALILICVACSFALAATYTWPIYAGAPITNTSHTYNGRTYKATDFGVSIGTEVYAIASGTVITAKSMTTSYGNHIIIDHGNGVYSLYAHLSEFRVSQNETVVQGQTIALSGNTGNSTGPHLHFEIRVGSNSMWNAQNIRDYCEEINVDTHTEDPAYASLKGTKVTASKEILVHGGNHVYYDRATRRIDAGDVCTIEAIYTDGCCLVTYPASSAPGGYRTQYAKKSDFNLIVPVSHIEDPTYASLKGTKVTASKEILVHEGDHVYYDRGTRRIDAGDECTIEAIYTDGCCLVTYPASSAPGGYRTLYAQKSDFNLQPVDSQIPVVSNIQVTDITSDGYIVTCNVSDNVGVTRVAFPTIANGESEFVWRDGTLSGNTASYRVNVSDHGGKSGAYQTEVYAYDAAGNNNPYEESIIVRVDVPNPRKKGSPMASGFERTIPDGDYIIASVVKPDSKQLYFLDIVGTDNVANGDNVAICGPCDVDTIPVYDIWTLTYQNDGFYSIRQKGTEMYLTVSGDGQTEGCSVVAWADNGGGSVQRWAISSNGANNGCRLQCRYSGFSLDVANGAFTNGNDVWQWENNDSVAQSWLFIPYKPERTLQDGCYILLSNMDENYELDVAGDTGDIPDGQNAQIWNDTGDDFAEGALSQYNAFDVEYIGEGYYKLIHKVSGKALTVLEDSTEFNKNVVVSAYTGALGQQWATLQEEGAYILLARCSGFALEVQNANMENGANVDQYRYINTPNKQWHLVPAEYTVQYSANGGSGAPEAQIKYYKGNLTISDEVPIREDYAFTGWNTKANGSGTAYAPGNVYRVDETVTLYAQWRRLSVLKLPKGIKTIEEQAFAGVMADVIEIPEGCSSIGSEAFLNCKELVKLYIPASVKQITFDAFVGCENLVIYAPEGSKAIQLAKRLNIAYEITE